MTLPAPTLTALNAPFWDALKQGHLVFQRCGECGHARLPPSAACPACLSENTHWQRASGRGHIVSWVVYHHAFDERFADRLPYNVALVELAEGPRLFTNIVNPDGLAIDKAVMLAFEEDDGLTLPRFRVES